MLHTERRLFIHISTTVRYSFIQNWGILENENVQASKGSKGDLNPGTLDCEFGILPLSYGAQHICVIFRMRHYKPFGPFYLVPMPGEVKDHTQAVNV